VQNVRRDDFTTTPNTGLTEEGNVSAAIGGFMKLSVPIYRLKSRAKKLKNTLNISLSLALNEVAMQEGFASWSLLMAQRDQLLPRRFSEVLDFLNGGDLVLVAARPGAGKSFFAAGLLAQCAGASSAGNTIFTLVEGPDDWRSRLVSCGQSAAMAQRCVIDCSNNICASYITATVGQRACPGAIIVVDYLQMLDEKRVNPPLQQQVVALQDFARSTGCIVVFLCQIDRAISDRSEQHPGIGDIRLPNPLDLTLFNKIFFLSPDNNTTKISINTSAEHSFAIQWDEERQRFSDVQ